MADKDISKAFVAYADLGERHGLDGDETKRLQEARAQLAEAILDDDRRGVDEARLNLFQTYKGLGAITNGNRTFTPEDAVKRDVDQLVKAKEPFEPLLVGKKDAVPAFSR